MLVKLLNCDYFLAVLYTQIILNQQLLVGLRKLTLLSLYTRLYAGS